MKFPCLIAVVVVALGLVSCSGDKNDPALVVGMDLSYPPFETIDPAGKPIGISVEIAEALAENLGRPVRIENIPFVGLIPALQAGRVDCVISSMTDTEERRKSIAFSDPYLSIGLALLVGKDSPVQNLASLDEPGRTLVVRQGTTGEVFARENLKNARIISVERENAAVLEVLQGKADAFIYDQMSVWKNWQQHPEKTRALLQPVKEEFWAVGLRQNDKELREQVNEFLKRYREAGGFEALGNRYLPEQKEFFEKEGIDFYF